MLVDGVEVAAGRVRLPDLDERARQGRAVLVEHASGHDDALAQRGLGVLAREVAGADLPELALERRARHLGEPVRERHERLRRRALDGRLVGRVQVLGLRAWTRPPVARDARLGGMGVCHVVVHIVREYWLYHHPSMPVPYRADQVGSFLRPSELLEARSSLAAEPETLRALEDRHVLRVIEKQKELGFEVFTDGELRRRNFMSDFTDAVEGFDLGDAVARSWQAGDAKAAATSKVAGIVTGKLRAVRRLTGHELPFLKAHSPGPIKITLPSATQFPAISWKRGITDAVYPDQLALLADIVAILKAELAALAAEGASYIQIDAPRYSYFIDPKWREWIEAEMRIAPDTLLDASIEADNACLEAARRPGRHAGDAPVPRQQPQPLVRRGRLRRDRRAALLPDGAWTASCSSTTTRARAASSRCASCRRARPSCSGSSARKLAQLENPDELARRIDEAARHVPLENLALEPAVRLRLHHGRQPAHARTSSGRSCGSWSRRRGASGAEPGRDRVTRTQVGIVGGGPAGLLLSHLLAPGGHRVGRARGAQPRVRQHRVRAGVLEQATVELLTETGLGERLAREGLVHHGIELRWGGVAHRIPLTELTGRSIWIYGQQEVVKDLIDARGAANGGVLFEVEDVSLDGIDSARARRIRYRHAGDACELVCDFVAGCDGFHGICARRDPDAALRLFESDYPFAWLGSSRT